MQKQQRTSWLSRPSRDMRCHLRLEPLEDRYLLSGGLPPFAGKVSEDVAYPKITADGLSIFNLSFSGPLSDAQMRDLPWLRFGFTVDGFALPAISYSYSPRFVLFQPVFTTNVLTAQFESSLQGVHGGASVATTPIPIPQDNSSNVSPPTPVGSGSQPAPVNNGQIPWVFGGSFNFTWSIWTPDAKKAETASYGQSLETNNGKNPVALVDLAFSAGGAVTGPRFLVPTTISLVPKSIGDPLPSAAPDTDFPLPPLSLGATEQAPWQHFAPLALANYPNPWLEAQNLDRAFQYPPATAEAPTRNAAWPNAAGKNYLGGHSLVLTPTRANRARGEMATPAYLSPDKPSSSEWEDDDADLGAPATPKGYFGQLDPTEELDPESAPSHPAPEQETRTERKSSFRLPLLVLLGSTLVLLRYVWNDKMPGGKPPRIF